VVTTQCKHVLNVSYMYVVIKNRIFIFLGFILTPLEGKVLI